MNGQVKAAVFFDLDDTLYDFGRATHEELVIRLSRLLGEADQDRLDEALEAYEAVREQAWQEYMRGQLAFDQVRAARFHRVLNRLNLTRDRELVETEADAFLTGWMERIRPFDGVRELLVNLAGQVTLGVITNGQPEQTRTKLSLLGLDHWFDASLILASEGVGRAKPDRVIFDLALERAGVRPDAALMVGDSLEADILGSLQAGWAAAVWLNRRGKPLQEDPAHLGQRLLVAPDFTAAGEQVMELIPWLQAPGGVAQRDRAQSEPARQDRMKE